MKPLQRETFTSHWFSFCFCCLILYLFVMEKLGSNGSFPKLSYRGKALVANNLKASRTVAQSHWSEPTMWADYRRKLWTVFGLDSTGPGLLYCTSQWLKGVQGLIKLNHRVTTFHLQPAQRFLLGENSVWRDTAWVLKKKKTKKLKQKRLESSHVVCCRNCWRKWPHYCLEILRKLWDGAPDHWSSSRMWGGTRNVPNVQNSKMK